MTTRRQFRPDRLANQRLLSPLSKRKASEPTHDAVVDCGWGNLIFANTFTDHREVAKALLDERHGRRHIAMYATDPHIVLAQAPQSLFLDPSHTYRLWLGRVPGRRRSPGFLVRRIRKREDAAAIRHIYERCGMVPVDPDFVWDHRSSREITYVVAEDRQSGDVLGTVTGIDHATAFDDPENGSSLWCLAVDPRASLPGIGEALVLYLAEHYQARGRYYLDLSVLHDNEQAIALYEKLGFRRVPVFAIKHKNAINEPLFVPPGPERRLNPYAQIIVNEALRRGIDTEILDVDAGYFRLSHGGRSIICRESLSELTTAIAMSRCQDKEVTWRLMDEIGIRQPRQTVAAGEEQDREFLAAHGALVVKPSDGEQGQGISVDVRDARHLKEAVETARRFSDTVLLQEFVSGEDLRVIVIGFEVVAAAIRRPATIVGDGIHSVEALIAKQSRRRQAATDGESSIPTDAQTHRCVRQAGYEFGDVPPAGEAIVVRKTANLHTGGTMHDVTDALHPRLVEASVRAARALDIPCVGLDFIVQSATSPEYAFIEANERAGLANHEPQPTAERFVDMLFPFTTRADAVREADD
jgi:GNAT-family acetyltransferase (TIGR03103 family)